MKRMLLIAAILSCVLSFAQSTGDIAFIGFNADGDDDFAIVVLDDIAANSTIYFTDNEPDGSGGLTSGEGAVEWQTGSSVIPAGTVVTFTDTDSDGNPAFGASIGTLLDGTGGMNLASTGDAMFAFLGSDDTTPTTFLAGIQNADGQEGNLSGTGLTVGSTFVEFYTTTSPDGGVYSGSRDTESDFADYLTLIGNSSNWSEEVSDGELLLPFSTSAFSTTPEVTTWSGNPSQDATIADNGNSDNAGDNFILGLPGASSGITEGIRGLMQFDLSSIPPGSTITDVSFTFTRLDPGGASGAEVDLEIYRLTNSWQEGTSEATSQFPSLATSTAADVTYTSRGGSIGDWTSSGGDFDPTISVSITAPAISGTTILEIAGTMNLIADVQAWIDGTDDNNGWIFITPSAATQELLWMASREDAVNAPVLEISYIEPITWTGTVNTDWNTSGNWDGDKVPISSENVLIPNVSAGSNNNPIITAGEVGEVNNLIINSGASLSIESGGSLAILGEAVVEGSFFVERNMTGGDGTSNSAGYSIAGVPVSDGEIQDFDAQFIFSYVNPSGFTANINGSPEDALPGTGFFVGYDAMNPSITFAGAPNTGDVTYPVTQTSGFELVANPYTAAIVTSDFLSDNSTVITGGVYFWDDGGSNVGDSRGGDYIAVTAMGSATAVQPNGSDDGVSGNAGTAGADNGFIPSVQGVFVEVQAAGDITFSTSQISTSASANSDANHYRRVEYQKVKLAIVGNGLYNEVLVGLGEDATFERDSHLDARKFDSENPLSFYSLLGEERFVIQGLPLVDEKDVRAKLGFDLAKEGDYQLKLISKENIPTNVSVQLVDHLTGNTYELSDYFRLDFFSSIVKNDQRFELVFSTAETLYVGELRSDLKIYGAENGLFVEYADMGTKEIAIYELSGKLAFHDVVSFTENRTFIQHNFDHEKIYVLRLDGKSFKFILK